jgi:phosphoribosylformimino-5-aminoimidazole carboxamide ribotide isomerase
MRILPAIDLIDGACVRLRQGDFSQKTTYSDDPLATAKKFEGAGLSHLHLVDLDGARAGRPKNVKILEKIAANTSLKIDFGGGISSKAHLDEAFDAGASQVNIGSLAIREPDLVKQWLSDYGSEKIVLAADVIDGKIAQNAWQSASALSVHKFLADFVDAGLVYVACTDVSKDGMMTGPAFQLYEDLNSQFDLKLIASGGVHVIDDVIKLKKMGLNGVIIGKAIYEETIALTELADYA